MMAEVLTKGLSKHTVTYIDVDKRSAGGDIETIGRRLLKTLCDVTGDECATQLVLSQD
jgi:hypothetical protein